jgi:DNA-binding NtrC family response regulator
MNKMTILVVDDEQKIADTLAIILQNNGYETTVAYEGDSALAQFANVRPNLLLTDVVMPGMNGIDLALAVSERFPACKVLLLSGQAATAELLDRAQKQGSDFPLLSKPIHPEDLLKRVAEIFNPSEFPGSAAGGLTQRSSPSYERTELTSPVQSLTKH